MFKNLKQKVNDQKTPSPRPHGQSETPQGSLRRPVQKAGTRRPSNSSQPTHSVRSESTPNSSKDDSRPVESESAKNDHAAKAKPGVVSREVSESPDVVQQVDTSAGGDAEVVTDTPVKSSVEKQPEIAQTPEQKVPFFKRLEFLTPLKDQIVPKILERKDNLNASLEDLQGKVAAVAKNNSKPDVVAQASERNRRESSSDAEEPMVSNVDISAIPKEQLFGKIIRLEKTLLKYREKYSEMATHMRDAKQENEKLKAVMQKSQDKNLRRIQEMKEQSDLDQKAKMHLEEEFRNSLEEKDQLIRVLQTQVAILKDEQRVGTKLEGDKPVADDAQGKINNLEDQLKFSRETCDGLRSQTDALQVQLNERLEELEKLQEDNLNEKSKLIKQLREAKNVIEQLEDDKQMAVAEAKRQGREALESKELELKNLRNKFDKMNSAKENELKALQTVAEQLKSEKEYELEIHQTTLHQLKADNKRQLESLQSSVEQLKADKARELTEKENQLKAALEESELSKMRIASQQDMEAQNTLRQLDKELENVQNKVEGLERDREHENKKYKDDFKKMEDKIQELNKAHQTELESSKEKYESQLKTKEQGSQQKLTELHSKIEVLEDENTNLTTSIAKLKDELEKRSNDLTQVTSSLQDAHRRTEEERTKSEQQLKTASAHITKLEKNVDTLEKKLQTTRQDQVETERLTAEQNSTLERVQALEIEKKRSETMCLELKEKLVQAEQCKQRLQSEIEVVNTEISKDHDLVQQLNKKLKASESKVQDLEQSLRKSQEETQCQNEAISDLGNEVEKQKQELRLLSKDKDDISAQLANEKTACANLRSVLEAATNEKESLATQLQSHTDKAQTEHSESQNTIQSLRSNTGELEGQVQALQGTLTTKETELNKCINEREQCQSSVSKYRSELESMRAICDTRNACIEELEMSKTYLTDQVESLKTDLASSKKESQENGEALQVATAEKQKLEQSLEQAKSDYIATEVALEEAKKEFESQLKHKLDENTQSLKEENQKKLIDLKKKAEQRLGQIKKSFDAQADEKQKIIIQLQEVNSINEQKLNASSRNIEELKLLNGVESGKLREEMEKLREQEVKRLQEEKENVQKSLEQRIATIEKDAESALKQYTEKMTEESCVKYEKLKKDSEDLWAAETKKFIVEKEQIQRTYEVKIAEVEKRLKMESDDSIAKTLEEEKDKYDKLCEETAKLRERDMQKLQDEKEQIKTSTAEKIAELQKVSEESERARALLEVENNEHKRLYEELQNKIDSEIRRFENEKAQAEKLMEEKLREVKQNSQEQCERDVARIIEEEKMKYEEEKLQLADVKSHLEEVLREAKLKLEETENKMMEEKDRGELAVQEEKDKRLQAELRLSVMSEDTEKERSEWSSKMADNNGKIFKLEKLVASLNAEVSKQQQIVIEQDSARSDEVTALRKRNVKLEKERDALKQAKDSTAKLHEQQIQALKGEINSAQKQVEVLANTAVDDNTAEVERKLQVLREDFQKRLTAKEEENAEKIKILVKEYEGQFQSNELSFQTKIDDAKRKSLSIEDSLRSQHHQDLLSLQREIHSKEKEMESVIEKYETEMHEMETRMSEQVDKAMYRAMTAEKKVEDAGWEESNRKLQDQLVAVNKALTQSQAQERDNALKAQSLEARVSLATPFADPEKLEYLRRVMYEYMMGNENKTMAKVLVVLLQFSELEAQQILERHKLSSVR